MKKISLGLITIVLFATNTFLLIHPFKWSLFLTTSFLLFFNFIIILTAIYFGAQGIIIFGSFGFLVVILHSLRTPGFTILPTVLLTGTILIFYIYCLRIDRLNQRLKTELDNVEEEKNITSVRLDHLRLENSTLKQKLNRYATLKSLTEALSSTLSLNKLTFLITDEASRIIDKANVCLLYLIDKEKQKLCLENVKLLDSQYKMEIKTGDIFDNWVFKQRISLMVEDAKKDFRFNIKDIREEDLRGVRSLISVPLIREHKLLGILRLDSISSKVYDADDLRLLHIIADLSGVAIENTLLYQKTQKLAITDGLTRLFVHRYFQERFDQEIFRALWTNSCFAFLMLDIDDFKHYNDRYGHIAGDIVLRRIAEVISSTVNPGDIVARYGGEEFAVLLVNTPKHEAKIIAERVREKIEKEKIVLRREITNVRISGGISFFPEDGRAKEDLIRKADQSLYKAKSEGKNRIYTI